jgi:hypothetical protein
MCARLYGQLAAIGLADAARTIIITNDVFPGRIYYAYTPIIILLLLLLYWLVPIDLARNNIKLVRTHI